MTWQSDKWYEEFAHQPPKEPPRAMWPDEPSPWWELLKAVGWLALWTIGSLLAIFAAIAVCGS